MADKQKLVKLEALEKRIKACRSCILHEGRTQAVPGGGNPDARILLIGEAPGRNEDEQGMPFVGMAGKNLDKLLAHAGIDRSQVYISNVVKCRPPNNRKPERPEMEACAPFLKELVELLDPELVVCLGSTAAAAVLGLKKISEATGRLMEQDGRYYFVTHHPAARFHRKKIAEDFDNLKRELKKVPGLVGKST